MNVIKKYWNYVYIYVLFLVPFLCMCAGMLWTTWKILGWNSQPSWLQIIIFDGTQIIYMAIGIFFIYKNKKDASFIPRNLKYVKAYVTFSLFIQFNYILYVFSADYLWECTFIFLVCIAFLFDIKLMLANVLAYFGTICIAYMIKPEKFLPTEVTNLSEIISWRLTIYWLTSICILVIVYFVERFLMQAWENKEENVRLAKKQLKYYEDMELMDIEIRKFRHDIQNHFICMEYLFQNKKTEELKKYFQDLQQSMTFQQRVHFSGNGIVDAILHYELTHSCREDVKVTVYGNLPEIKTVSDIDLCTIFSNLLSNAIASANQCIESGRSQISIHFSGGSRYFSFVMSNSILEHGSVKKKKDRNHGHGVHKIKNILEKYDGRWEQRIEQQILTITVYLPI